jgi:uncharacterized membrane protein required for colicin V production
MLPASLTTVDSIAIIFILAGGLQGLLRGLSGETARLLGALCAFVAGALLHEPLGDLVVDYTRLVDHEARILTYVLTVLTALLIWALLHKIIKRLLQLVLSKGFDKLAGIPAGMLRTTALVGILFIGMNIWPDLPLAGHFGPQTLFGHYAIRCVPAVQRQLQEHHLPVPAVHHTDPHTTGEEATP